MTGASGQTVTGAAALTAVADNSDQVGVGLGEVRRRLLAVVPGVPPRQSPVPHDADAAERAVKHAHLFGNAIPPDEREELRELGAVGDVCLRFFDHAGQLVPSPLNARVLGIAPPALMRISRRVGGAGGPAKCSAIRAALLGGWANIVVTDLDTARNLISAAESAPPAD